MRDKQIEELTRIICQSNIGGKCGYDGKPCDCDCGSYQLATKVYNAGYRKKSDVAREIFEEIEDIRLEHSYGEIDGNELNVKLFNLKKKYESEGEG